jgi:predicted HicB family RNase H-like nuclease
MKNNLDFESDLNQRTENVMVRMTPEEKQTLVIESQKAGISISAFIRLLLNNWMNNISFTKSNHDE